MEILGKAILYIIMACCMAGALAAIFKEDSGLAHAFHEGLQAIVALFIPIVGIMVSVPYLIVGTEALFGQAYSAIGADPAVAAATFVPCDCGGYALALAVAGSPETAIISLCVAIMAASTFSVNIPVGLSILQKRDHPYMALGAMSGILSIPFGVFITCLVLIATKPSIRTAFVTTGPADYVLDLQLGTVLINLLPLVLFCALLALGLKFIPNGMVKGFQVFGKVLMSVLTLIVACSIVEHYTGVFTAIFGGWGFDPILADENGTFRAMELLGSIAMMLTGAFPLVYLIRTYCRKPLEKLGRLAGLDATGSAGLIAGMANAVALFDMVREMRPRDKVVTIAFVVCAGYCLGDWIAFNVNFQPNLVVPLLIGQIGGGVVGIIFARLIAVPQAEHIAAAQEAEDELSEELQEAQDA